MSTNSSNTLLTEQLLATARELQLLPSLKSFALAGGTNLALRIGHRKSIDIDLFSNNMVGIEGLKFICNELHELYGRNLLFCEIEDPEAGEQYCFIKSLLTRNDDLTIKIEILQNIALMDPFEEVQGIRLITKRDVGLLKLMSASNRMAKKDIYDLDHITDEIALADLMMMLAQKHAMEMSIDLCLILTGKKALQMTLVCYLLSIISNMLTETGGPITPMILLISCQTTKIGGRLAEVGKQKLLHTCVF